MTGLVERNSPSWSFGEEPRTVSDDSHHSLEDFRLEVVAAPEANSRSTIRGWSGGFLMACD